MIDETNHYGDDEGSARRAAERAKQYPECWNCGEPQTEVMQLFKRCAECGRSQEQNKK